MDGDLRRALWSDSADDFAWGRRGGQVALDIARGLHFLHSSGIIHRFGMALSLCHPPMTMDYETCRPLRNTLVSASIGPSKRSWSFAYLCMPTPRVQGH